MRKDGVLRRPFRGDDDRERMIALARAHSHETVHHVDLPYRLSSWALDDPDNVALWTDIEGHLVAWAVMQTPFWTVDCACVPDEPAELHRRMVAWADDRARQLVGTRWARRAWFVNVLRGQASRVRDLEDAGFACQAAVPKDPWSDVLLWLPAGGPLPPPSLPQGFVIRPLNGEDEVSAYVELHRAVFESSAMTVAWRRRILSCPDYHPELDLVVVAPDRTLAGLCVGWLGADAEGRPTGQIEPLGVRADLRRHGLGRALLVEALQRLRLKGAIGTLVQTEAYRGPALRLYASVGFRVLRGVWVYRKDYA